MILEIFSKKHGCIQFIVDDDKAEIIKDYYWCVSKESVDTSNQLLYAVGWKSPKAKGQAAVRLHRLLTSAPKGTFVDHINGNTLDNRLENLRITDHTTNMRNTRKRKTGSSIYKGVCFRPSRTDKWEARVYFKGKTVALGYYQTEEQAALAYNNALDFYGLAGPRNNIK
jgi:hypothetical protein